MNRLVVFVVGCSNSGKTTFSNELAHSLNGVHLETSDVIRRQYERLTGCIITEKQKDLYRKDLQQLGDLMTSRCKSRIVEMVLSDPDIMISLAPLIITGIRRRMEYFAALELAESNGYEIRTVFVSRGSDSDDHFSVTKNDVGCIICNNGSIDELEEMAFDYAKSGVCCELA
jgi:adenylate kinase family enzyme